MNSNTLCLAAATSVLLAVPRTLLCQRADPGAAYATRESLQRGLEHVGRGRGSGGSDAAARLIKARLDSGDFRSGDRIVLRVEGEKELSDTFTVGMATELLLPQIGAVPLAGVLRVELRDRLAQALGRYLRSPVVHVRPLVRVAVEGEVVKPGYYGVAPEAPLLDVLAAAGGMTREANLRKARVERDGSVVIGGRTLQDAFSAGRSLDALNLQAGDRLVIPRRAYGRTAQIIGLLTTIPVAVFALTQIFK